MEIRDKLVIRIVDTLTAVDDVIDDAGIIKARIMDDIVASLTPAQRVLLDRWHSYICEKCGHTMIAHTEDMKAVQDRS